MLRTGGKKPEKPREHKKPSHSNGRIVFSKFSKETEEAIAGIKNEINKRLEGETAEEIAAWFCEEVDKDRIRKGNGYFDALIKLIEEHVHRDENGEISDIGEGAEPYVEIIEEVHDYFTKKMENKERGKMHWENMQKRFKEAGLPIEIEE